MKRSTVQLIVTVSALYFAVLFLARSLLPGDFKIPLYFLAAPLLLVVLVLASDLSGRATVPTKPGLRRSPRRKLGWDVEQLTRQIDVGVGASSHYYDTVLLARLREILLEKVSLETGMEKNLIQEMLKNKTLGPGLLGDGELYTLLYSGAPARGPERVKTLERLVGLVEAWKP